MLNGVKGIGTPIACIPSSPIAARNLTRSESLVLDSTEVLA